MTKPKPPCIVCAEQAHVRTEGGGTPPLYRYRCARCDATWQQLPPHRRREGDEASTVPITKGAGRKLRVYLCTACQKPKRKHQCEGFKV